MEKTQPIKKEPLPMLFTNKEVKESDFKLVISEGLETKIRTYCALSPNREWSGVLFYTFEGNFDEGVIIKADDLYLMDQGTSVHTEFDLNEPEITRYMVMNGLYTHCMGLLHSHNTFGVFFSGEDSRTLQQYGMEMNNFVSVVVNNAGDCVARLTKKTHFQGTKKSVFEGTATSVLFNTGIENARHCENTTEEPVEDTWIEYVDLTVLKPKINPNLDIFHRFGDVNHKCSPSSSPSAFSPIVSLPKTYTEEKPATMVQGTLFEEEESSIEDFIGTEVFEQASYLAWEKHGFGLWFARLVQGSPFIFTERFLTKEVAENYTKAFPAEPDFELWFETWLDYMVNEFDISWIRTTDSDYDGETFLLVKTLTELRSFSMQPSVGQHFFTLMCNIVENRLL